MTNGKLPGLKALRASALTALCVFCGQARAFDWFVTSPADANVAGTLRFAVNNAAANDTIHFVAALGGQTITLTLGELQIKKNLTIAGLGAKNLSIADANGRVFHVMNGPVSAVISGFHLTGHFTGTNGADGTFGALDGVAGEDANGGGILNGNFCTLTVSNCFFQGCQAVAGNGGNGYTNDNYGFLSNGGNGGSACGGAVCNDGGDLFLHLCAFSSNSASSGRGGNGYYSGTGGRGGEAEGGALCDTYGNQDMFVVDCTFYTNFAQAGYGGNAGDAYIYHVGAANGGAGGVGGGASGGAIFIAHGCPMPDCTGLVHNTICQNFILPGGGQPGGAGIHGGAQGASGANGAADGGGLFHANAQGHVPIDNTIIAGDFAIFRFTAGAFTYNGPDVFGDVNSLRYNLIGVLDANSSGWIPGFDLTGSTTSPIDPRLGPFQDNGGETPTMAPLACSPAIDAGSTGGFASDQIGQTRPKGITAAPYVVDGSDIGAYELQSYPAAAAIPLTITRSGNGVIISWPSSSCFVLQQSSTLNPPNWGNTPPFNIVGGQKQVTIAPATGNLFFRLFHP